MNIEEFAAIRAKLFDLKKYDVLPDWVDDAATVLISYLGARYDAVVYGSGKKVNE